jgi:N-acetylmuramoyl-L-alanine amidase
MPSPARRPGLRGFAERHRVLSGGGVLVTVVALAAGALALSIRVFVEIPGVVGSAETGGASASSNGEALDPETFASGSCVAYPPTSGDRHLTVFLDAGHGGVDPGSVGVTQSGVTIHEADETLRVELDTMALLRAQGFRVVVSRTGDSTVVRLSPLDESDGVLTLQGVFDDVAARARCANDAEASALVGIYFDAGGSSLDAGCLTAYDTDRSFSAANLKLATLVQNDVLDRMNAEGWAVPNDGVQDDTGLGSLNGDPASGGLAGQAAAYDHLLLIGPAMAGYFSTPSQMPGVVIEPLYITDPYEGSLADSANGETVIAGGISSAVEQFLARGATQ